MMIAQVRMWPAQQPETCRSSSVGDGRYLQTRNLALHAVHLPTPGLRVSGCVSRAVGSYPDEPYSLGRHCDR